MAFGSQSHLEVDRSERAVRNGCSLLSTSVIGSAGLGGRLVLLAEPVYVASQVVSRCALAAPEGMAGRPSQAGVRQRTQLGSAPMPQQQEAPAEKQRAQTVSSPIRLLPPRDVADITHSGLLSAKRGIKPPPGLSVEFEEDLIASMPSSACAAVSKARSTADTSRLPPPGTCADTEQRTAQELLAQCVVSPIKLLPPKDSTGPIFSKRVTAPPPGLIGELDQDWSFRTPSSAYDAVSKTCSTADTSRSPSPGGMGLTPSHAAALHLEGALVSLEEPHVQNSPSLFTKGSRGHGIGVCKPCAFVFREGCQNGVNCSFCHLCPPGEQKLRKRERKIADQLRAVD